jgi:hypothetical protein
VTCGFLPALTPGPGSPMPPSSLGLSYAMLGAQQEHRLRSFGRTAPGSWLYSFELNAEPVSA